MSQNHPADDDTMAIPHPDRNDLGSGGSSVSARPSGAALPEHGYAAVKWRRPVRVVVGIVLIVLGLLWTLQGADMVRIRPILCVANCQPITGGSPAWLAIGVVTLLVGLRMVSLLRRRR